MSIQPFRQVHLDFHTAPVIPDIAVDFDPGEFIRTLKAGHVDSVTVFARCHHGYCYYPTEVGTPHPHLKRPDLLGEMIEACQEAGIRAPVYTTVMWDELSWANHPEWRQVAPDGGINGPSGSPLEPGWKNLCVNTGYADYLIAHIEELLDRYDVDGLFIDIVLRPHRARCVCSACLDEMARHGVDPKDPAQCAQFAHRVARRFMDRATQAIHAKRDGVGVFYNSRLQMHFRESQGNRPELDDYTHLEIESLPGGFWGYDHFPLYARYYQDFDRPLLAMTGRFDTLWGDFGGLRNRAMLEFECFQALAHGAQCSIGDQLHPRGRLDPAVYARIGEVYAEVEAREPWCVDSCALPEIGVMTANNRPVQAEDLMDDSDRGALHILEQAKHQFCFLDAASNLSGYAAVILPDTVPIDAVLAERLRAYVDRGGKLLVSDRAGLQENTELFALADVMGVQYEGRAPFAPDYLVLEPVIADGIPPMPYVCEMQGARVTVGHGDKVLAWVGAPYFNRTWEHFCSHQYSPFDRRTASPAIVESASGNIIYIARPLFREYAESARLVHKQVIVNCLARLLPRPWVGTHSLPSTAIVTVRRQRKSLIVHLLHYIPQRRGRVLDVIEDVIPLHDIEISIRAEHEPKAVRLVPQAEPVEWTWANGYVKIEVPSIDGYQIVVIEERD